MLIAVDTHVPLDLANEVADVADALAVVRERIPGARLIAPRTVALELAYLSEFADETACGLPRKRPFVRSPRNGASSP